MNKREIGTRYEDQAAEYLSRNGYEILQRNYRCRLGEIDLIARDGEYLCFIEVKYRSDIRNGYPAEAIDRRKIMRIRRTAQFYLLTNHLSEEIPCRFDVISILGEELSLICNAF